MPIWTAFSTVPTWSPVLTVGKYEDNVVGNSTWADGDWDCDGDAGTSDLVLAFQRGGYVAAAQVAPAINAAASRVSPQAVAARTLERPGDDDGELRKPLCPTSRRSCPRPRALVPSPRKTSIKFGNSPTMTCCRSSPFAGDDDPPDEEFWQL